MNATTLIIILLILLLFFALPVWPYAAGFGYGPSGVLLVIVVVLIILALTGRL